MLVNGFFQNVKMGGKRGGAKQRRKRRREAFYCNHSSGCVGVTQRKEIRCGEGGGVHREWAEPTNTSSVKKEKKHRLKGQTRLISGKRCEIW